MMVKLQFSQQARLADNIAGIHESVQENPKPGDFDMHPWKIRLILELKVNNHK